ncbi:hypothetical protein ABZX51_009703 [Aspergillus tubingensis]|uniref:Uncharacterized protein n=1 Tax=Aspergillus tubingensis (strain CBS 134.48) TaxID=767770 RepID=A0A1L9NF46_ASPTC|nr:hypothetical protein ASPTUDRAFT_136526 [Aspergillus tubingensis CBS 134.48]
MKLISAITTAALAFAAAGSAAVCTPGLNYCTRVLTDVSGSNFEAIQRELQRTDNVVLSNTPGLWGGLVFHCNNDHSITEVQRCPGGCVNAGAGQSDYCSSRSSPWG